MYNSDGDKCLCRVPVACFCIAPLEGGFLYVSSTLLPFLSACCSCVLSIASFSYIFGPGPVYRTIFFFAIRRFLIHATPILFLFLLPSFAP